MLSGRIVEEALLQGIGKQAHLLRLRLCRRLGSRIGQDHQSQSPSQTVDHEFPPADLILVFRSLFGVSATVGVHSLTTQLNLPFVADVEELKNQIAITTADIGYRVEILGHIQIEVQQGLEFGRQVLGCQIGL